MCAKEKDEEASEESEGEPVVEIDSKVLEDFASGYLNAYREYISGKDMDERHLPQFYKAFPFTVEIFNLPNRAICALFNKSNRSKFVVLDGDFEDVNDKVKARSFDFLQTFSPFTQFDTDEAERLAIADADRDLKAARRLELLGDAEAHINEIHEDVKSMVDLNPWLDEQTEGQKNKLARAKELIEELYREVEQSREERFAEYSRQVMELMAFERTDMEEMAGDLEIRMEEALEGVDERFLAMEKFVREHEPGDSSAVKKLEDELAQLTKTMKEMNLRLKDIEAGNIEEELDTAISKVQRQVKDASKEITELKKELNSMKGDVAISKEIKETVFRDSKRAHNLNDRTSDLETEVKELRKLASKDRSQSEFKALEGKLNILEKELKEYARDYTKKTVKREIDKIPMPEPAPSEPPKGATVKKTTTKTSKKTSKKKK